MFVLLYQYVNKKAAADLVLTTGTYQYVLYRYSVHQVQQHEHEILESFAKKK